MVSDKFKQHCHLIPQPLGAPTSQFLSLSSLLACSICSIHHIACSLLGFILDNLRLMLNVLAMLETCHRKALVQSQALSGRTSPASRLM